MEPRCIKKLLSSVLMKSVLEQRKVSAYSVLNRLTKEDDPSLLDYVIDQGVVTPLDYKNFLAAKYEDEISETLIGLHTDLNPYGDHINYSLVIEFPGTKIPSISKSFPTSERMDDKLIMLEKKLCSLLEDIVEDAEIDHPIQDFSEDKIVKAFDKLNKDMPTPLSGKIFYLTLTIDGHDMFEVKYTYAKDEVNKNGLRFNHPLPPSVRNL